MKLHVVVYILCWLQAASKGALTNKKCQQTLIIDLSCNTAMYTRSITEMFYTKGEKKFISKIDGR
jgi:hypothetical protein